MDRLALVEWMIKHNVSTQHTNLNSAVARALDHLDVWEKHSGKSIIKQ